MAIRVVLSRFFKMLIKRN